MPNVLKYIDNFSRVIREEALSKIRGPLYKWLLLIVKTYSKSKIKYSFPVFIKA
jgi:hypothetical protein